MIRIVSQPRTVTNQWHRRFLAMLPAIQRQSLIAFRHFNPEARHEAVAECVANAFVAYHRLLELNKPDLVYPTVLAKFAIRQVQDHRKVGGHLNVHDVLSPYCQMRKSITVDRLDRFDPVENAWEEVLIEDKNAGPAEVVATKLDVADWLSRLPRRNRQIAQSLAIGNHTGEVAKRFNVSAGRIAQLRQAFARSWCTFQGETAAATRAAAVVA